MVCFVNLVRFLHQRRWGGQTPGQFVSKPFNSWVKMSERSKAHMQLEYHQTSIARMREFVSRYEHPTTAVNVVMDTAAKQLMEKNERSLSHC